MSIAPNHQSELVSKRATPWDFVGVAALTVSMVFGILTVALALILR